MNTPRPFPQERPSRALRDETAFMERHGGRGARAILRVVTALTGFGATITASCGWLSALPSPRHIGRIRLGKPPMQEKSP